jgi:excisionase family DNA binding protein
MAERFTIAEASELTGLSKGALARRVERGHLPATKDGRLRYVSEGDLVEAGLLNPNTGSRPAWARQRIDSTVVAREVVQTLVRQSIEIHELQQRLHALRAESREDDEALRREIEQARAERRQLRKALEDARAAIAELRAAQ